MKTVILDFDDFSLEVNNLYYIDLLKKTYPKMKVSMFYIPFDVNNYDTLMDFQRAEVVQMIKDRDWIELIPHGLTHQGPEFMHIKNDDYETVFRGIEDGFNTYGLKMVKGFKAPHWAYKQNLVDFLDAKDWWLGVDRNHPEHPRAKRSYEYTHSIDEVFWESDLEEIRLHGHVSLPSRNNLVDNMVNLMKIDPKVDWKFVSEVMNENS